MKKKQKEEIKLKSTQELRKLLEDSQDLLLTLKLDKAQNKLKNQRQIFWERKKIALFLTLIGEKGKMEELAKIKKEEKGAKAKIKKGE